MLKHPPSHRPSRNTSTMTQRMKHYLAALLACGLGACASAPPGADFPKAASTALADPETTDVGRQFATAARDHGGETAYRIVSVGVDGFLLSRLPPQALAELGVVSALEQSKIAAAIERLQAADQQAQTP